MEILAGSHCSFNVVSLTHVKINLIFQICLNCHLIVSVTSWDVEEPSREAEAGAEGLINGWKQSNQPLRWRLCLRYLWNGLHSWKHGWACGRARNYDWMPVFLSFTRYCQDVKKHSSEIRLLISLPDLTIRSNKQVLHCFLIIMAPLLNLL